MSLFKPYNYKDRPEREAKALKKNRFFIFWEIFFRKFWRFISLNLIYFIITLPILMFFYLTASGYIAANMGEEYIDLLSGVGFIAALLADIPSVLYMPLLIISVLIYGPARMGFTYVYRNYTREEHAWISDVWEKARENWKQGLILGVLDFFITLLLVNNIVGVFGSSSSAVNVILTMSKYVSAVLLVVFLFVRHFTYLIAISVELPVKAIIRNSSLFCIMAFGRNVLTVLVCGLVWIVTLFVLPLVTVVSLMLLTYSICGFAAVYICYPTVKKYIILPAIQNQKDEGK